MKSIDKNIKALIALFVFASLAILFTHTFLEQIENGCAHHENHDFSNVIVNVLLEKNSSETNNFNITKTSPFHIAEIQIFAPLVTQLQPVAFFNLPSGYSTKIFLTKFRSLLI